MEFTVALDMSYVFKYKLQLITWSSLWFTMVTDYLSLFDVLTKLPSGTEKHLIIDLQTVQSSYKK